MSKYGGSLEPVKIDGQIAYIYSYTYQLTDDCYTRTITLYQDFGYQYLIETRITMLNVEPNAGPELDKELIQKYCLKRVD